MKKVITVCLCLILALSALSVACAEDFTIHAGTMFGDTIDEVKSKEDLKLINEIENDNEIGLVYKGKLVGYDGCRINYCFDSDKYLYDVYYTMPSSVDVGNNGVEEEYDYLLNALTDKYGNPLDTDDDAYYCIVGEQIKSLRVSNKVFEKNGSSSRYEIEYVGWSIPSNDYNVKIELMLVTATSNNTTFCYIDYHKYTDDELAAAKEEYENTQAENLNDL